MDDRELAQRFERHRPHLRDVAQRMLGSRPDAEDAVQECWLRLQRGQRRGDVAGIDNLAGWLTTVVSRICLDRLRTRRARPESLLGEAAVDAPAPEDPESDAIVADSVGRALVVMLDRLSPAERVAFVLHDVFAVPFDEIAPILDRSPEATKKLAGRARRRLRPDAAADPDDLAGRREVIRRFLDAIRTGDMSALLAVLAPDAVRHVDPVLLEPGHPVTVRGAGRIVDEARTLSTPARDAEPAMVGTDPGAVVVRGKVVILALTFDIVAGLVERFEVIADPQRLTTLRIRRKGA